MTVVDPGISFSVQTDLDHAGTGSGAYEEVTLIDNPNEDGYLAVYFVDIDVQKVGSTNALEEVRLEWKDSTPTYYECKTTAADWQGPGMRSVSPVPGADLVTRVLRDAAGAATGHIIVSGAILD